MGKKITLEDINAELEEIGWRCVSHEYINRDETMNFICNEGHHVYAPWKKIKENPVCPTCVENKLNDYSDYSKKNIGMAPKQKKPNTQRILALDQATRTSGFAIMDNGELITYGIFEAVGEDEIDRDHQLKEWLVNMIIQWDIDLVALEGLQFQEESAGRKMGVTVFQTLCRLQGILMETCFARRIPYVICPTNTWRNQVGVKGRSRDDRKRSAQLIIKDTYGMLVSNDESDAILIARYATDTNKKNPEYIEWDE